MIKQLLKISGVLLAALIIPVVLSWSRVSADGNVLKQACVGNASNSAVCNQAGTQGTTDPIAGPNGIISIAANIIAVIAGIGIVFVIVLGGMALATSGGKPDAVAKAKARITSAFIGLVLLLFAWTIVKFITDKVLR